MTATQPLPCSHVPDCSHVSKSHIFFKMEVQCLYHYRLVNIHLQANVLYLHVIFKIIFYFPSVNNCLIFYLPTTLCIDSLFSPQHPSDLSNSSLCCFLNTENYQISYKFFPAVFQPPASVLDICSPGLLNRYHPGTSVASFPIQSPRFLGSMSPSFLVYSLVLLEHML